MLCGSSRHRSMASHIAPSATNLSLTVGPHAKWHCYITSVHCQCLRSRLAAFRRNSPMLGTWSNTACRQSIDYSTTHLPEKLPAWLGESRLSPVRSHCSQDVRDGKRRLRHQSGVTQNFRPLNLCVCGSTLLAVVYIFMYVFIYVFPSHFVGPVAQSV